MEKVNYDKKEYDLEDKDALLARILISLLDQLKKLGRNK